MLNSAFCLAASICIAAVGISTPAAAAADAAAAKLADGVMQGLQSGNTRAVMEGALPVIRQNKPAEFDNLVQQSDSAIKIYGPITKWELLDSEPLGSLLEKRTYVSQHKLGPLFWTMIMYRGPGGWEVTYFVFTDKVTERFGL